MGEAVKPGPQGCEIGIGMEEISKSVVQRVRLYPIRPRKGLSADKKNGSLINNGRRGPL